MLVATCIVLAATAAANIGIAVADLTRANFVVANSAEVGVPNSWLPRLALAKAARSIGILLWFVHLPALAVAAAAGLVCIFIGSVAAHVRAGVFHNVAFPCAYLALAAGSLTLLAVRA